MTRPFFICNNINSLEHGIIINKLPHISRAEERIEKIKVDGRHGVLHSSDGTFEEVIKSVECTLKDKNEVDFICSWLRGNVEVIFSNEPDKFYKGYIINQVDFKQVFTVLKSFIIQIECDPFKYLLDGKENIVLTNSSKIYNLGTYESQPVITIDGSGDIELTINDNVINLNQLSGPITLDSNIENAFYGTVNMNNKMEGEFPTFKTGENNISWVGNVNKLIITPNWRCL